MDILLLFTGFIFAVFVALLYEYKIRQMQKESRNKVHFYVARDKNGSLFLYFGKPYREGNIFRVNKSKYIYYTGGSLTEFGLNENDYANLKWEDEPLEVFVNMED